MGLAHLVFALRARERAVIGVVGATAFVALTSAVACGSSSDAPSKNTQTAPTPQNAEPLFRALQNDLVSTCGGTNGSCHVLGSYEGAPTWLGGDDPYVTIKKYRGVLPATKEVGDSIILTQIKHEGPALTDTPDLFARVSEWLSAEVPGPPLPNTGGFSVGAGFNVVPLDTVASGLATARLTFLATESNGTLTLTALKITAPNNANVVVDSPFFVILPRSGKVKADPEVNGFQGTLTIPAGQAIDLFTGKMILLRWDPTGRLKVAFNQISTTPGQAVLPDCTALDLFKSSALPAMNMPVDVLPYEGTDAGDPGNLGQSSCLGCHGAEPPSDSQPGPAVQAMDLRNAATDPATACLRAKQWINLQDKANSTILLNPTGKGNQVHPMQPVNDSDPIIVGIKAWVDAEK